MSKHKKDSTLTTIIFWVVMALVAAAIISLFV
jgi:Na+-transporting NADH:ubiquinone oxidoreductase subunit NqrC